MQRQTVTAAFAWPSDIIVFSLTNSNPRHHSLWILTSRFICIIPFSASEGFLASEGTSWLGVGLVGASSGCFESSRVCFSPEQIKTSEIPITKTSLS